MSKVLIAWEIGGGFGHFSYLVPLTKSLRASGHEVSMVVPNAEAAKFLDIDLIETPLSNIQYTFSQNRINAADTIIARYRDFHLSCQAFTRWLEILDEEKPDKIVVNHAPMALMAAKKRSIPVMEFGTGYAVPKRGVPMPNWVGDNKFCDVQENLALRYINAITELELETLSDLFDSEQRILCTVPEFDHYKNRENGDYFGLVKEPFVTSEYAWPDTPFSFNYFPHYNPALIPYFQTLQRTPGTHFIMSCRRYVNGPNFVYIDQPVNLQLVFERADFIGTAAGHNMLLESALNGVPVITLPRRDSYEQERNAQNVEELGVGTRLNILSGRDKLKEQIESIQDYRPQAELFAEKYKTRRNLEELLVFF